MTLDIPIWAKRKVWEKRSPFHKLSVDQLINLTYESLKYIDENSGKGPYKRAKWINILHSIDSIAPGSEAAWYSKVKQFNFEGWAFASEAGIEGGIVALLKRLRRLQEDKQLDNKEWMHFLGMSKLRWAMIATAIQRGIRKTSSPNIQVSYDSASGSISMATGKAYPQKHLNADERRWNNFSPEPFPVEEKYAVKSPVYPFI